MGGTSIFRVKEGDPNLNVILETLTGHGRQTIMAQRFIPEISEGDKRILMIKGKPVPYCLARVPLSGRNPRQPRRRRLGPATATHRTGSLDCRAGQSSLIDKGLLFVGLDIIGDYLTEINVTSPTCIREIDA